MRLKHFKVKAWSLSVLLILALSLSIVTAGADGPHPGLTPASVEELVFPGESTSVDKLVHTPAIPPRVEICLLEDETGSFGDDIANLQGGTTASDIFDNVVAVSPTARFAVAGFRDYPTSPYGSPGDWVYRLLSPMSAVKADWLNGIAALTAGGGNDTPEAQYDAIVAAVQGGIGDGPCGYNPDPLVTKVLVVTTDAPFHLPGVSKPHANNQASTIEALNDAGVRVVGLKAPDSGGELDALAANTGGNVQPLSSSGDDIADAILTGLGNLPVDVEMVSDCTAPISVTFAPLVLPVTSGEDAAFTETIAVAKGAEAGTYVCYDWALINGEPMTDPDSVEIILEKKTIHVPGIELTPDPDTNELLPGASHTVTATVTAGDFGPLEGERVEFEIFSGPNTGETSDGLTDADGQIDFTYEATQGPGGLGIDEIKAYLTSDDGTVMYAMDSAIKEWEDTTPPVAACEETVNPNGNNVPKAPGNGGQGQNQDGFYVMGAFDLVWPEDSLEMFVTDDGSGTAFGPFTVGTRIKYTEANGATPSIDEMGGNNGNGNGQAEAVDWHIKGNGDAFVTAVDGSGNTSAAAFCLVPPPPK